MTTDQRRARLVRRHLLAPSARATCSEEVAEALVGLHATDAATVALSAYARLAQPDLADLERALYEDGTLRRMHCMRRTLFVVPTRLVPVYHHATATVVAAQERSRILKLLASENPDWDAEWLAEAERAALATVERLGGAGAVAVRAEVPRLRETVTLAPGKPYESRQRIGGWVLRLLAMDGRLRRGRPLGGWTSGQFSYHLATEPASMDASAARAELVRRWLESYGPGTTADVKWWTGWTVREVRRALGDVGAVEVELDGGSGWLLPTEQPEEELAQAPTAVLLPGLDPTTMGWKQRDWYLDPEHTGLLFDSAGNAGPTVWWNGEIIGGWACRADGEIVWRQLVDRGSEAATAVESEAARLAEWLGDSRFVPSFPTPLAKQLTR